MCSYSANNIQKLNFGHKYFIAYVCYGYGCDYGYGYGYDYGYGYG